MTFVLKFCVFQRHSILACSKSFVHTLLHNFTILLLFKYQKNSQLDQTCLQVASLLWLPFLKSQPYIKSKTSFLQTFIFFFFFPLSLCSAWDNARRLQETFLSRPQITIQHLHPFTFQHRHLLVILDYSSSSQFYTFLEPYFHFHCWLNSLSFPHQISCPFPISNLMKFPLVWSLLSQSSDRRLNLKGT